MKRQEGQNIVIDLETTGLVNYDKYSKANQPRITNCEKSTAVEKWIKVLTEVKKILTKKGEKNYRFVFGIFEHLYHCENKEDLDYSQESRQ